MENTNAVSAKERVREAFLQKLAEKPCAKITVSELIQAANVNRSTFYRNWEDVPTLLEDMEKTLTDELLGEPTSDVHTAQELEAYTMRVFEKMRGNAECLRLLAGKNGEPRFPHDFGCRLRETLTEIADREKLRDEKLRRCIGLSTVFVSSYVYDIIGRDPSGITPTPYDYDLSVSFSENVGRVMAESRGGNPDFHEALWTAHTILRTKQEPDEAGISVTKLLQTAGFGRTEFYRFYTNIETFEEEMRNASVSVAAAWGYLAYVTPEFMLQENMERFLPKAYIQKALFGFLVNNEMTVYFPPIQGEILRRIEENVRKKTGAGLPLEQRWRIIFYMDYFAAQVCQYYLGRLTYRDLVADAQTYLKNREDALS